MDLVSIALILVALWIGVLVVVLAICKASGDADADEDRYGADGWDDASDQHPAASTVALGDDRRSIAVAEREREAGRLGIELPERRRLHLRRTLRDGSRQSR